MDEDQTLACLRHMLQAPVKAGPAARPEKWPWSSAAADLKGAYDGVTEAASLRPRLGDVRSFLAADDDLPVSDDETTGRTLQPKRRGPKLAGLK